MPRKRGQGPTLRQTYESEYAAWLNAMHRCHNPAHFLYPDYGGRGISVCDEWRKAETGFSTFMEKMGPRPSSNYSLERVDNDAGYTPDNCIWADQKTQCNNRRKFRRSRLDFGLGKKNQSALIEYQGRIQTLKAWADELGMKSPTLRQRLKRGLSIEQAFTATTEELKRSRRLNVLKQITIH